jgi:hypothetical protein
MWRGDMLSRHQLTKEGHLRVREDAEPEGAAAVESLETSRRYHLSWRQLRAMPRAASVAAIRAAAQLAQDFTIGFGEVLGPTPCIRRRA